MADHKDLMTLALMDQIMDLIMVPTMDLIMDLMMVIMEALNREVLMVVVLTPAVLMEEDLEVQMVEVRDKALQEVEILDL